MKEKIKEVKPGFTLFIANMLMLAISLFLIIWGIIETANHPSVIPVASIISGSILLIIWFIFINGFFTLQPNEAAVLILFGEYKGTVKKSGWYFTNPFYTKKKISLRSRNINGEKLKVNDEAGNPIEIAAVIVWRVENTFQAVFDVENYIDYVKVQSESAIRHLAGMYPYDITDQEHNISLRGSSEEIAEALKIELQERLGKAGVVVEEARLSHLAYSPEIAAAMLQRQQASAIISARQKIVEGAVGMVQMALTKLSEDGIVELDEERKAAMVSNLLVVLCGERSTQPVINTGTLHN
ncbi:SPFH domain-containing protein [Acetivibrio cellulolyticus]|uniref:SPFH domain-containing protein n=1 Tax=Acetivibrio cellulolyticus TaxID=35830 RepID=UPI0001E2D4ED|nr:SPFH domain-containing protein [Acetivibrio cellulolyticus]